ncbi:MAG: ectonucleotide pyrophosphatase/phosphodiesterase [Bacteroidales bacterium]
MKKIKLVLVGIFVLTFLYGDLTYAQTNEEDKPYVVILSMDGFRWDYPEKANTPNLDLIAAKGVKAQAFIPSFPTKTFSNHFGMATGLYTESHGIVLNKFFANDLGKKYNITSSEFYTGEPIWATAERQGVKSASYFWLGSEAPIEKALPTYYLEYNEAIPFENRADSVISWLQLPENERPHLIMWYIHEPDAMGNKYGPNSKELVTTVEYLDKLVGDFYNRIQKLPIAEEINLIFLSDHGMAEIHKDKAVFLNEYVKPEWLEHQDGTNPIFLLDAKNEYYDSVYIALKKIQHVNAWKREDVPARMHFSNNIRIKDFVVLADSSWSIWPSREKQVIEEGAHGYDNANSDMHAIFYAIGPAFKNGYVNPPINNVDLYPLVCKILNLKSSPNEGSLENVLPMLKE